MSKLSELLQAIKDNPEDLSNLPTIIEQARELETDSQQQLEQIGKLQENYRKVIKMIPVPEEPKPAEPEQPKQPTIADAVQSIQQQLNGG